MAREPIRITLPASEAQLRALRIGDEVLLDGIVVTGRDTAHKYLVDQRPESMKALLKGAVIYHCGPIMKKVDGAWTVVAAGPTTSNREEPYQADVIENYRIGGVIGKGGMGDKTSAALVKFGAVYFHAVGGAGTLLAQCVTKVRDVLMLEEFGTPEAFWVLEVKDFPVVVTMDAAGGSLHREVLLASEEKYRKLIG